MTGQHTMLATGLPGERKHEHDRGGNDTRRSFENGWQPGCQEGGKA